MSFRQPTILALALIGAVSISTAAKSGEAKRMRDDVVSETIARDVLYTLASDDFAGRDDGTDGGRRARAWLVRWLAERGLTPAGDGAATYEQAIDGGANLIAILPDRAGRTAGPVALLSAHYDGLGSACRHRDEARSAICNGAADNAGGVAAVLAAVDALRGRLDAPVAVALWDREEDGLLGSAHFVRTPTFDRATLRLMINLDVIGLNLFRGLEAHHFAIGAETGGDALARDLAAAGSAAGLELGSLSYAFGHRRNDTTSFVAADWRLPFVFLTEGDGSVYHTDADEAEHTNLAKIVQVGEAVASLTRSATAPDKRYDWNAPAEQSGMYLPVFADAQPVRDLAAKVRQHGAANQLGAAQLQALSQAQASLDGIIAAGPRAWSAVQGGEVARVAQLMLSMSRGLPFIP